MLLILQDSITSSYIDEIEADFIPNAGETFILNEGLPNEINYTVVKRLYPTLLRNGVKVVRLRVRETT